MNEGLDFVAVGENIIVTRDLGEGKRGGIIIPEAAREKSMVCTVVDGGETQFKPGDKVLVGRYCGMEFEYNDNEYLVVGLIDIVAKKNAGD